MRRFAAIVATTAVVGGMLLPVAPVAQAATVSFAYTGNSQTWNVPAGVQSVHVTMTGGAGGGREYGALTLSNQISGVLTLPAGTTQLEINVGGSGGWSANAATSTTGGWGNGFGGANGGTATGTGGWAGGSGGGATDIRLPGALPSQALMVAAGAGGSGGDAGSLAYLGGAGTPGSLTPATGAAGAGSGGDGGAGGTPGTTPGAGAGSGGNAPNSNDGGGGGGGGGWIGGGGGAAGQADTVSFYSGAGGGGAGGLSYGDPSYVQGLEQGTASSAGVTITYLVASAWAPITLRVGEWIKAPVATTSEIGVTYELASGEIPPGMTLDGEQGTLSGAPAQVGNFTFNIAVRKYLDARYPITTVVTDQWTVNPGNGAWLNASGASGIAATTATLNGFIKGGGEPVSGIACRYSTDNTFATGVVSAPATPSSVPASLATTLLNCPATGLTGNTVYFFQFYGTQAGSQIFSNINAFTSSSTPAVVTTGSATSITSTSAVGNGTVSASQNVTSIVCRAATELQDVATATPVTASPSSTTGVVSDSAVTCSFSGLSANTLYYYGVFATDAAGTSTSTTWSEFVTDQAPPRLGLISASDIATSTARISGSLSATNQPVTSVYCRVVTSPGNPANGSVVAASPFTAVGSARDLPVACSLSGLSASTAYRVRMYAVDADGTTSSGNTVTVTTTAGGGGGGGSSPAPEPAPTPIPTTDTTTNSTSATVPVVIPPAPPQPELVLPGLVLVPSGSEIPIRIRSLQEPPGRTLSSAPAVSARRNVAFAVTARDLPRSRALRVDVGRGDTRPIRWEPLGTIQTNDRGRATLPALLSTRKGTLTFRLTSGRTAEFIRIRILP